MRLKRKYQDILFDIIEDSEFEIKEFGIHISDVNDEITIKYNDEIYLFFKFQCLKNTEYLVTYNTPLNPDNIERINITFSRSGVVNEKNIKSSLSRMLTNWLKEINEEIRTPDKFMQYFNNLNKLKFNDISESKGKQPPSNAESKILIQQLDDIKKTISENKNILLDAQEILFDELEEIKEVVEKKQLSLRLIYNTIIGTVGKWCVNFAISSEVVKTLTELVMNGIRKMLGE